MKGFTQCRVLAWFPQNTCYPGKIPEILYHDQIDLGWFGVIITASEWRVHALPYVT